MKNLAKITLVFAVFAFTFTQARPAKAFYLEVPRSLQDLLSSLKTNKSSAQEAGTMMNLPTYQAPTVQAPSGDQNYQGMGPTPGQDMGYQGMGPQPGMPDGQNQGTQGNMDPGPNQQGMQQGGQQGQGKMQQGDQGQQGPSPEQQAKQLAQMKRGTKQMASQIKQFEKMITDAEKKGTTVPEEVKTNLAKMKSLLDGANNATSMEDMQDVDMSEMGDLMQSMDEFRRDVVEKQQRLDGMKRGMKGMEQGLKMFKSQIAKLTKQKITVPTELSDNITKLEAIIAQVKTAKTSEEIDAIDFDSMQELMQNLDENRQQLEVLARWPQTLKQVNQQLTQLTRELKKSKTIVDRLAKKDIDLQAEYTAFADAVAKLQSVRDDAVAKMAAGNSEEAFTALEDDFFGQIEDAWQNQRVIMMMSNLGGFASSFKQNINQSNSVIKKLKLKKLDTAELESIVAEANAKGQEVIALLKVKPLDQDTVTGNLDDLENLRQEFSDKVSELTGEETVMPWEQGPQQFKQMQMSPDVQKFMPQKQENQMPQVQTTPMQPQAPTGPSGF